MWLKNRKNKNNNADEKIAIRSVKKSSAKLKSKLLLLLIFVSIIATLPIFQSTDAAAVKKHTELSFTEQIKSHIYLFAVAKCIKEANLSNGASGPGVFEHIPVDKAPKNDWFAEGLKVNVGPYISSEISGSGDGEVDCSNTDFISKALALWGLSPIEVLCHSNFRRRDTDFINKDTGKVDFPSEKDCTTMPGPKGDLYVPDEFGGSNKMSTSADVFKAYIASSVGSEVLDLTTEQNYIYYRHTLNNSCIPGIDANPPSTELNGGEYGYNNVRWVDISSTPMKILQDPEDKSSYTGSMKPAEMIKLRVGSGLTNDEMSCLNILGEMNKAAPAYLKWAINNPDKAKAINGELAGTEDTGNDNTCGAKVAALGWIVCPIIDALATIDDAIWAMVSSMLTVNPLRQSDDIYKAWSSIRSIANVVFVLFFLIIIFSQLTGAGITNYGVKKLLPKVIIAAILVNISFIIVQLAVDLANIIGTSLYDLLKGMAPNNDLGWGALLNLVGIILAGGAVGTAAFGLAALSGTLGIGVIYYMILPFAAMAALGLITALLTLIFRQAAIPVLAIIAPLAFVAYLLPNTESWFKKWMKLMMGMLMMYPLAALVFGGAYFASRTIIGDGTNFWNFLIGLIMLALPLFSLPFIARQGGPMLSKVGGALNGLAQRARDPLNKFANPRADAARARRLAESATDRDDGTRRSAIARFTRGTSKRADDRRRSREKDLETDKSRRESQWSRRQGVAALDRSSTAQNTAETVKLETASRFNRSAEGMAATDRLNETKKVGTVDTNAATTRSAQSPGGGVLDREIKRGGLQNQTDEEAVSTDVANDMAPGGGADLHQALSEAKGRTANDTLDIKDRYETSAAGMALTDEQTRGNLRGQSTSEVASSRVANDFTPGGGADLHQAVGETKGQTSIDTQAIKHRYDRSAEGIRLNQEQGVGGLRAQIDEKAAAHRLDRSAAGQTLHQAVGEAELIARADKGNISTAIEQDTGLLQVRMEAETAEKELSNAKAETAQIVSEASSTTAPAIPGVDATIRTRLQATQLASNITTNAKASADRVLQDEFQREVISNAAVATQAAGIDTVSGVQRIQAAAVSAVQTREAQEVTARAGLLESGIPFDEKYTVAGTALDNAITSGTDVIGARAGVKVLLGHGMGAKGRDIIRTQAARLDPADRASETSRNIMDDLQQAGIKEKDAAMGAWAKAGGVETLAHVRADPDTYRNIGPEAIATQDLTALKAIPKGAISDERIRAVLASDELEPKIDPARRNYLISMIQHRIITGPNPDELPVPIITT